MHIVIRQKYQQSRKDEAFLLNRLHYVHKPVLRHYVVDFLPPCETPMMPNQTQYSCSIPYKSVFSDDSPLLELLHLVPCTIHPHPP